MFSRIRTILPVLRNIPRNAPKIRPMSRSMIRSMSRSMIRSMSTFQQQTSSTDNHNVEQYQQEMNDMKELDYFHLQSVLHANDINFATYLNVREYDFQSKE